MNDKYTCGFIVIQRLIKACGETKAGPTEKEEIEFLCTVCAKIKTDPYLVNFFIEVTLLCSVARFVCRDVSES